MQAGPFFVGAISGTSVDGLDLALIDVGGGINIVAATTVPFPANLRDRLLRCGQPGADDLDDLGAVDRVLGRFIGSAILEFVAGAGLVPADIAAIGSHGQTVRHRPSSADPFTWQIGDPNQIAELTGITTVADFRRRDMAAGGEGAPLVPPFHAALFRDSRESRAIVNIGGIGNVTLLPSDLSAPIRGFDTGPGNALLDSWCFEHLGQIYDQDGRWSAGGRVLPELLAACLSDPYFTLAPPKSTGREYFNLRWLRAHLPTADDDPAFAVNVQRTLVELTARSIVDAIANWAQDPCERIILCGGGRLNAELRRRMGELADAPVATTEDLGYDGDAIEAATFAWLAWRRLNAEPGNAPSVTGAAGPRVLGAVYHR